MKPFIAVVGWTGENRIAKFQDFDTEAEANNHVLTYGGFIAPSPGPRHEDWLVDPVAKTLSVDVVPPVKPTKVLFDDFEARFTVQEWDAATDFVYEVDTATGKPKRRALVQGLARAQARNRVDLLDAKTDGFLSALVAGGVITTPRKSEILTP